MSPNVSRKRAAQRRGGKRRRRFFSALTVALVLALFVPACSDAAEDAVIALPPFLVEEAAKGPPWRYADLPGYEVLSRCPDRATQQVIEAHYRLHQLLGEILPAQLRVKLSVPKALILYDEELQPAASQEVIARMIRSTPAPPTIEPGSSLGRGFRTTLAPARVTFLPNLRLWDRDAMAVFMIVRGDDFEASRLALTPNYISYLLRSRVPALPSWFVTGFMALYDRAGFDTGELTLPRAEWISAAAAEALRKNPKSPVEMIPWEEFFAGRLSLVGELGAQAAMERWRAQAAIFVRWGLDGRGAPRRAALWAFVARCASEPLTEDLFRECFGLDFAAAGEQIAAYLPVAVRNPVRFRAPRGPVPTLLLRNATDAQVARIKGDWERMEVAYVKAISPELAPKYLDQARRTLVRAYERDVRDPGMLAVLGLCEVDAGNDAGARPYLEAAAGIGKVRPRAWYELARLRLAALRGAGEEAGGQLSSTQTVTVLAPLFAARADDPPMAEVYELIAETWANCAATPTRGHLAVLDEGVRLFPRRTLLVQRAAELYLRHGFRVEAAALVEIGLHGATDDATRAAFVQLRQALEEK